MINSNTDVYEIDNSINPFCLFFSLQFQYFCNEMTTNAKIPTDIYDLVPTNEFAMESISWPLTPKSHILISPLELTRMFDGFTSEKTPPKKKKFSSYFTPVIQTLIIHPCNWKMNPNICIFNVYLYLTQLSDTCRNIICIYIMDHGKYTYGVYLIMWWFLMKCLMAIHVEAFPVVMVYQYLKYSQLCLSRICMSQIIA